MNDLVPKDESVKRTGLIDALGDSSIDRAMRVAEIMATGVATVPKHLKGNVGDCFSVALQAMRWRMDPIALAQKTHLVNGVLGFEAQLVNAILISSGVLTGRPKYEWYGDWTKVIGRFKEVPAKYGDEKKTVKDWSLEDEKGLGIIITATIAGETEPRTLDLLLSQAGVRNSPLWGTDPKQQLGYLAIKRWARLHAPDVLLGVHTTDELQFRQQERDMGSADEVHQAPPQASRSASVASKLAQRRGTAAPVQDVAPALPAPNPDEIIAAINRAMNAQQLTAAVEPIGRMTDDADRKRVEAAYKTKLKTERERAGTTKKKDAEPPPPADEEPQSEQAGASDAGSTPDMFSYAEVADLINKATNDDQLAQAGDLIGSINAPDQRQELATLFETKQQELSGA